MPIRGLTTAVRFLPARADQYAASSRAARRMSSSVGRYSCSSTGVNGIGVSIAATRVHRRVEVLERLLRDDRRHLGAEPAGEVVLVDDHRLAGLADRREHRLAVERYQRAQVDHLDRGALGLERVCDRERQLHRRGVGDDREVGAGPGDARRRRSARSGRRPPWGRRPSPAGRGTCARRTRPGWDPGSTRAEARRRRWPSPGRRSSGRRGGGTRPRRSRSGTGRRRRRRRSGSGRPCGTAQPMR